jgi:hypothetical protein
MPTAQLRTFAAFALVKRWHCRNSGVLRDTVTVRGWRSKKSEEEVKGIRSCSV